MDLVVVPQKVFEREVKDYRLGTGQLWAWLGRGKFPPDVQSRRESDRTPAEKNFYQLLIGICGCCSIGWSGMDGSGYSA